MRDRMMCCIYSTAATHTHTHTHTHTYVTLPTSTTSMNHALVWGHILALQRMISYLKSVSRSDIHDPYITRDIVQLQCDCHAWGTWEIVQSDRERER
jgi:hypothetical protein